MKRYVFKIAIVSLFLILTGCASIFRGTTQSIDISSSPSRAKIYVNGENRGQTPQTIIIDRGADNRIRLMLDGFEPYEITLTKDLSVFYAVIDLFTFPVVNLVIDFVTGAIYTQLPENLDAVLAESESAKSGTYEESVNIKIRVVLEKTPGLLKIGQLTRVKK